MNPHLFICRVIAPTLALAAACLGSVTHLQAGISIDLDWHVKPGDRSYVSLNNTERGLGFRAASGNLLLVSREGVPGIHVLSAADGSDRHSLDTSGVTGGLFPLNKVAVAEDGVVYAANMTTSAGSSAFKIYRWANDEAATTPLVSYSGDPGALGGSAGQRWGDTLAVRGSGLNTQIIAGSNTSGGVAVFTTTDGEVFVPKFFPGVGDADGVVGLAFGAGDTFYTKKFSAIIRLATFNLATGAASTQTLAAATGDAAIRILGTGIPNAYMGTIAVNRTAAGLGTVPDTLAIWNITNPTVRAPEVSTTLPLGSSAGVSYDNDNSNGAGSIVFGPNAVYALNTNNGIMKFSIIVTGVNPPVIETPPAGITILEGGITSLSVVASGDQPLSYRWTRNGMDIQGAMSATLELGPVAAADEGTYAVRVGNSAGSATSADAIVTVLPRANTAVASPKWTAGAGSRPYLSTSARTHRGMDVNPTNGNILVATRELGTKVHVLNGQTGADLRELDTTLIIGGTFAINMIGVADDGAVYAGNLTTDGAASAFRLYRWADDAGGEPPFPCFGGDPADGTSAQRWGDTMDVRGAGINTQILLGSRTGSIIAVLSTTDGFNFFTTPIQTDAIAGDFGLGLAFGEGATAWGTASGRGLRRVSFNLNAGTAATTHFFPTTVFPGGSTALAVDTRLNCLAALVLDTPNTLQLFDISNLANPPVRLDQELFNGGRVNVNSDGTGAVAFGNGTVYGLATNNGLIALNSTKSPTLNTFTIGPVTFAAPDEYIFTIFGQAGTHYQVQVSTNLANWTNGPAGMLDGSGQARIVLPVNPTLPGFARVVPSVTP